MKWDRRTKLIAVGTIGILLILFGVIQGVFKLKLNEKVVNEVTLFLMVAAFALYFGGRKKAEPSADAETKPTDGTEKEEEK